MRNTETDNEAITCEILNIHVKCNQWDEAFVVKREMKIDRQPLSFSSKFVIYISKLHLI